VPRANQIGEQIGATELQETLESVRRILATVEAENAQHG
jgi:hypothetical protein